MRRSRLLPLIGAAALLWGSVASAAPTAAMKEAARHLMDEGKERTAHGDLPRALEAYKSAHELMRVPTTGLAVARTLVALNQLAEAYEMALETSRLPVEEGEHPALAEAREKAKALAADLADRMPKIQLVVRGTPKTIAVDDKELPLPLLSDTVPVVPGSHVVTATDAQGKQVRERVEIKEHETRKVELALGGEQKPAATKKTDEEPPKEEEAPTTPSGERTGLAKGLLYGGFTVGVLGLGVGAVTGFLSMGKATNVKPQCENNICGPEAKADLDSALTLASISTVGFVVAGVGVSAGVIGLLLPRKQAAPTTGFTGLDIGPGSIGYRGTF